MTIPIVSPPLWRQIQKNNFTNWEQFADFLELSEIQKEIYRNHPKFFLNIPRRLAEKIEKRTLEDPILKQFLPVKQEGEFVEGFALDAVGDQAARKTDRLIHKYQGRVLLIVSGACAMHCRYCFRQNFDYRCGDKTFVQEIDQIASDTTITEVILSGGDPLSIGDEALGVLLDQIGTISHIKRIRFHTRFPIGIPERITESLLGKLKAMSQAIWFVVHINHPHELDHEVLGALARLRASGVQVLNQSVLLKGVNDSADTLVELYATLVDHGVLPYYLHQLDRVQGASHFEVPEELGLGIMQELMARLPGYAVPKYVRETAGEPNKTVI